MGAALKENLTSFLTAVIPNDTPTAGTTIDLRGHVGEASVVMRGLTGGGAPPDGALICQLSPDGTNWFDFRTLVIDAGGTSFEDVFPLPEGTAFVRGFGDNGPGNLYVAYFFVTAIIERD